MHENNLDSEIILDVLGNDTRRKILAALSQQPMYFNQIAREIDIGQQAILRHLQTLESRGIVETFAEKSDLGAPDRKYYKLSTSFTLTVALSADNFSVTSNKISESRQKEYRGYYEKFDLLSKDAGSALLQLQDNLADVEKEISELESRLNDLRALKQLILHRLHEIGIELFEEDERMILYKIVEGSPKSFSELSVMVDTKESDLRAIMKMMKDKIEGKSAQTLFRGLQ
jgi:ArsR family transcriptional regulator